MSDANRILDIHRWELFEFGYDGWVLIDKLSDWRTLAKLAIEALLKDNNADFNEVINIIRKCNPRLAPDSAVGSFMTWIKTGGIRPHGVIKIPDILNSGCPATFDIFYGYVFPFDYYYEIADFMKIDIKKMPVIDSFWMPKDTNTL